jgi:hypothetical protein
MEGCFGISPACTNRAFWLASRFLGCGHWQVKFPLFLARNGETSRLFDLVQPLDLKECGFVYHAYAPTTRLTKIGFSRRPAERLRELVNGSGLQLELISLAPGAMMDEHAEHCRLREHRKVGEWFDLSGIQPANAA